MNINIKRANIITPLKTYKYKILVFLTTLMAGVVILSSVAVITTDISATLKRRAAKGEYAMVLPHYSSFDFSDFHSAVKPSWKEETLKLTDGRAVTKIHANVYPINLRNVSITYASDNENVATVDENGNIEAKNPGAAKIKIVADNGERHMETEAELTVVQPVTGLFMPETTVTLYKGSAGQLLKCETVPQNATNQNMVWQSKNEKVVTVDNNGHVKPVGLGMAEVVAKSDDGGFEAKCYVTVVNYSVDVNSVSIKNDYKEDAYLRVGESINLVTETEPENARNKTLKWTSSNIAAATVSQTGRVLARGVGKTTITVSSVNGKTDTFNLTVQPGVVRDPFNLNGGETYTSGGVTYTAYNMSLLDMTAIQMNSNPVPHKGGSAASYDEVKAALDPSAYSNGAYKYQFLDLSYTNGISEESLNAFLADKGILRGHGADFIAAARAYNVSEVYLVAHACLETGNGTSTLANGVLVGGVTVYNVYGIGAYDSGAVFYGSRKAYQEGWTDVSSAIMGGAQWISSHYINTAYGRQNTLYKMRWNPDNPSEHQYATDIEWATQQAVNIERIFRMFPEAVKSYDVPVYNDTAAVAIDTSN